MGNCFMNKTPYIYYKYKLDTCVIVSCHGGYDPALNNNITAYEKCPTYTYTLLLNYLRMQINVLCLDIIVIKHGELGAKLSTCLYVIRFDATRVRAKVKF